MSIIDKANEYVGHSFKMDESYTTSVRRDAYARGCEDMIDEFVAKLHKLKCGYENDLDAEPRVYERDIQLCAKISLIERLILELEEE